jgi:hypothetical protein
MAGRPRTRERRERERRSGRRFDDAARRSILKRAEEIGPAAAAGEAEVSPGTLRTWRRRLAERVPTPVPVAEVDGLSRADRLRLKADRARSTQQAAEDRADQQIGNGQSAEARNSSVVAAQRAERAAEYEAAARAEELHEVALAKAAGEEIVGAFEKVFSIVGLKVPGEVAALVLRGEPVPAEVAVRAREQAVRERHPRVEDASVDGVGADRDGDGGRDGGADPVPVEPVDELDELGFTPEERERLEGLRAFNPGLYETQVERRRASLAEQAAIDESWEQADEPTRGSYLGTYQREETAKRELHRHTRGDPGDATGLRPRPALGMGGRLRAMHPGLRGGL